MGIKLLESGQVCLMPLHAGKGEGERECKTFDFAYMQAMQLFLF